MGCDFSKQTPIIALRFDDNFLAVHEHLKPIMDARGIRGTMALGTYHINLNNGTATDSTLHNPRVAGATYGTVDQVIALKDAGWELAQHGIHGFLSTRQADGYDTLAEIDAAIATLNNEWKSTLGLDATPEHWILGCWAMDHNVLGLMRRHGYKYVSSQAVGWNKIVQSDHGLSNSPHNKAGFGGGGGGELPTYKLYRQLGQDISSNNLSIQASPDLVAGVVASGIAGRIKPWVDNRLAWQWLIHGYSGDKWTAASWTAAQWQAILDDFAATLDYAISKGARFVTCTELAEYLLDSRNPHAVDSRQVYCHPLPEVSTAYSNWREMGAVVLNPAGVEPPVEGMQIFSNTQGAGQTCYHAFPSVPIGSMLKLVMWVKNGTGKPVVKAGLSAPAPYHTLGNARDESLIRGSCPGWTRICRWFKMNRGINGSLYCLSESAGKTAYYSEIEWKTTNLGYGKEDEDGDIVGVDSTARPTIAPFPVLPAGLAWGLDMSQDSDTDFTDISGNAYEMLSVLKSQAVEIDGIKCRYIDSTAELYLPVETNALFANDFTYSMIVKYPTRETTASGTRDLLGGASGGLLLRVLSAHTLAICRAGSAAHFTSPATTIDNQHWHMITITKAAAGGGNYAWHIYVDGVESGIGITDTTNLASSQHAIGRRHGDGEQYTGYIDMPMLWSRALTAVEVANLAAQTIGVAGR